jgi:hypothetical protein
LALKPSQFVQTGLYTDETGLKTYPEKSPDLIDLVKAKLKGKAPESSSGIKFSLPLFKGFLFRVDLKLKPTPR